MSRQLVKIVTIDEVKPHPNADRLELAYVGGWQVVVAKGEFKSGDTAVYFEVDSFLPETDTRFSFLKNPRLFEGKSGFRLRTIKLRNALSQGLLIPSSKFPGADEYQEDLASWLGVVKWEPTIPACLSGKVKGSFPSFIPKTDQERVQNLQEVLMDDTNRYEVTIKLDGSSATYYCKDGEIGVCSRNQELSVEDRGNSFVKVGYESGVFDALKEIHKQHGNVALQGELIGEGVQGNPEKIRGHEFWVFDVYRIGDEGDSGWYINPNLRRDIIKECGLKHVPVLETDVVLAERFPGGMTEVLEYAEGKSLNPLVEREGVVFKTVPRSWGKRSFKAISNKYLLSER